MGFNIDLSDFSSFTSYTATSWPASRTLALQAKFPPKWRVGVERDLATLSVHAVARNGKTGQALAVIARNEEEALQKLLIQVRAQGNAA